MKVVDVLNVGDDPMIIGDFDYDREPALAVPMCECDRIHVIEDDDGNTCLLPVGATDTRGMESVIARLEECDEPYAVSVAVDKFGETQAFAVLFEDHPMVPVIKEAWAEREEEEQAIVAALLSRIPE